MAGFSMGSVMWAGIRNMTYHAAKNLTAQKAENAELDLIDSVRHFDGEKITSFLQSRKQDTQAEAHTRRNLDYHTALLFYCDPKISKKITGLKSQDGHELVQEQADHFIVWDADAKREKRLEKIIAEIDPATKAQICGTYDVENDQLSFHFGGTDFMNMQDLGNAALSLTGAQNPRASMGAEYVLKTLNVLHEKRPELKNNKTKIAMYAHSSGATLVAGAIVAAASKGFYTNSAYICDPCGGRAAFATVANATDVSSELLEENVVTIKPCIGGALDHFVGATGIVGTREECAATGHRAKGFVIAQHNTRAIFN